MPSNEEIIRRFVEEAANKGNLAVLDELLDPGAVYTFPGPEEVRGPAALKEFVGSVRAGFPDLHIEIDELISAGDRLVAILAARGTNTGELKGMPATGRHAAWSGVQVLRFEGGRIVECRVFADRLEQLEQLGLVPAPQAS